MQEFSESFIDAILGITIYSEEPPPTIVCTDIAEKLLVMARKGNATAASLYTMIAAFGNCEPFDANLGCDLLFKCKYGFDTYKSLVIDYIYMVIENNDTYNKIECFPITHTLEQMISAGAQESDPYAGNNK